MGQCCLMLSPDTVAAVEMLGNFQSVVGPGGCYIFPNCFPGCYTYRQVSLRVQQYELRCITKTKDNVFVTVNVAVQVQIMQDKARDAIYKLQNASAQIDSFVTDVVRGQVPRMKLDDVFESKDEIALTVRDRLTKDMADYGYTIVKALVTDLAPDASVVRAMNEIDASRRLRMAAEEKAEAEKIVMVKAAEAAAESKYLQGVGIARQRQAILDGLQQACGNDPARAGEMLMLVQYFDTLREMSTSSTSTIFMPHSVSNMAQVGDEIRTGVRMGFRAAPTQQAM